MRSSTESGPRDGVDICRRMTLMQPPAVCSLYCSLACIHRLLRYRDVSGSCLRERVVFDICGIGHMSRLSGELYWLANLSPHSHTPLCTHQTPCTVLFSLCASWNPARRRHTVSHVSRGPGRTLRVFVHREPARKLGHAHACSPRRAVGALHPTARTRLMLPSPACRRP